MILTKKEEPLIEIYTDGASRGNPGLSASAFIFVRDNEIQYKSCKVIGTKTNNEAEYQAIILALQEAIKQSIRNIEVYSDSRLVIKQLNGEFRANKRHLQLLKNKIQSLSEKFASVKFVHVPRSNGWISKADELCNDCLNDHQI
ncbi:MAG: ribonuclease HI family protein [Candidatus Hodarchaeales archaeon]